MKSQVLHTVRGCSGKFEIDHSWEWKGWRQDWRDFTALAWWAYPMSLRLTGFIRPVASRGRSSRAVTCTTARTSGWACGLWRPRVSPANPRKGKAHACCSGSYGGGGSGGGEIPACEGLVSTAAPHCPNSPSLQNRRHSRDSNTSNFRLRSSTNVATSMTSEHDVIYVSHTVMSRSDI